MKNEKKKVKDRNAYDILLLNGPNINMLGLRNKYIYGSGNYDELVQMIKKHCEKNLFSISVFQSNVEGELVDQVQKINNYKYLIINPAAYSHTSIAIRDAMEIAKESGKIVIEVHISNIHSRDDFRKRTITGEVADAVISGLGIYGYISAIDFIKESLLKYDSV